MAIEQENGRIHVELVYAAIDLEKNKLGIFNKLRGPDTLLRDHDRVEIYRPLLVDPKESRRRRAALRKNSDKNT